MNLNIRHHPDEVTQPWWDRFEASLIPRSIGTKALEKHIKKFWSRKMNDRFENLMYHAGMTAQGCWDEMDGYQREAVEKFALLIVRECMDIAKSTGDNFGSANPDVLEGGQGDAFCVYQNIKNTFGVKE